VPHLGEHDLIHADGFTGILSGAALVFFAFIGFDEVTTLAEETRRPSRTIPLALFAALGVSTVLYIGVAIASVSILGADALAASDRPLADALADSVGGPAAKLVAAVAMVSTTNTTLMVLTAASRVVYGIASDAALPPMFANVGRRSAVPVPALVACTAVAAAFVLLDDIETVAGVTDVAVYAVFVAVNVAVIVLRLRKPETPRPFRIPVSVRRIPVVPIAALAAAVLLMTRISFDSVAIGAGAAALGALLWWFARPARRRAEESLARARAGGVDT
jgi:APA family basic amino acid/polyamine antiporter